MVGKLEEVGAARVLLTIITRSNNSIDWSRYFIPKVARGVHLLMTILLLVCEAFSLPSPMQRNASNNDALKTESLKSW